MTFSRKIESQANFHSFVLDDSMPSLCAIFLVFLLSVKSEIATDNFSKFYQESHYKRFLKILKSILILF